MLWEMPCGQKCSRITFRRSYLSLVMWVPQGCPSASFRGFSKAILASDGAEKKKKKKMKKNNKKRKKKKQKKKTKKKKKKKN